MSLPVSLFQGGETRFYRPRTLPGFSRNAWVEPPVGSTLHRVKPPRFRPCENPYLVPDVKRRTEQNGVVGWEDIWGSCDRCEPCLARRVHDMIGRAGGEALGAEAAFMSTHTIGGDRSVGGFANNRLARQLDYALIQSFVKRLRIATVRDAQRRHLQSGLDASVFVPPRMRFFVTGEYGSHGTERAHYHMLSFWYGCEGPPDILMDQDFFWGKMDVSMDPYLGQGAYIPHLPSETQYWPWGFSNWKAMEAHHGVYVSKYLTKGAGQWRDGEPKAVMRAGRSTMPMVGAPYLDFVAVQHVDGQLPLQDREYRLPVDFAVGSTETYYMNRAAVMRTCRSYQRQWMERHQADPAFPEWWPRSDLMEQYDEWEFKRLEKQRAHRIEMDEFRQLRESYRQAVAVRRGGAGEPAPASAWDFDHKVIRPRQRLVVA